MRIQTDCGTNHESRITNYEFQRYALRGKGDRINDFPFPTRWRRYNPPPVTRCRWILCSCAALGLVLGACTSRPPSPPDTARPELPPSRPVATPPPGLVRTPSALPSAIA